MVISHPQRGFTLIELSIVLVIVGLLVGGIFSGQLLVRASQTRSVTVEAGRYLTAIFAFKDKYMALPGDMTNATSVWGAQDPVAATCQTTSSSSALTCDGNGNGQVGGGASTYYESFRFWQHLANAGLIEGNYTGVTGAGGSLNCVMGTNCPQGKITNSGFGAYYYATAGAGQLYATGTHQLIYGGQHASFLPTTAILRGDEAGNIDTKMDDGQPGYGKIIGPTNTSRPNCVTTDVRTTAAYDYTNTALGCDLFFLF